MWPLTQAGAGRDTQPPTPLGLNVTNMLPSDTRGQPGKVTEYQPPCSPVASTVHNLPLRVVIVYPYLYQTV